MAKCTFPLDSDEKELGTWTTNFVIPDIGRYLGDLTVTDKRIIYLSKFDTSINAILDKALLKTIDGEQFLVVSREKIKSIIPKKSMLNKRITLITDDDNEFIIDYGMLSIDSILKALEN
ncbi:MAG: hypothetical protein SCJ94_08595 [Bacillota bacterium]|nr:hypothetical protein [Bacillota bacterium]